MDQLTSIMQARGDVDGYQIRIRGENSDDTTEDGNRIYLVIDKKTTHGRLEVFLTKKLLTGWWQEAIPWNTMAHMAWLAAFGLDFHEINEPYISSPDLQPALKFFNRYVTSKRLEYARQGQKRVSSNKFKQ